MPELPDLTIFARNLKTRLSGRTVTDVKVYDFTKVNASQEAFEQGLLNARIEDLAREGKELKYSFSSGAALTMHLMLGGKLAILVPGKVESIKSRIFSFTLDGKGALVLSDSMKMAKVTLNPPTPKSPDVFSPDFTLAYFKKVVQRNGMKNIKDVLTTPSAMRGIGNAYADEIFWKANISPLNFAGKIPQDAQEELYHAIGDVLRHAIAEIDRLSPDIISGEVRSFLSVHNPAKQLADDGERILVTELNKRKTYYTAKQRFFP